jgi:hypothetical protein
LFRGSIDISADSLAGFSSDYNVLMNRMTTNGGNSVLTLGQWQAAGRDLHSIIATPSQLFVNPTTDLHLSATSLALDIGQAQFAPAFDFEGTARPSGAGVDIGADERGTAGPPPVNQGPTNVLLSGGSVAENSANGALVGTLSAVDPNSGDSHSFTLLNDAGGRFAIAGNRLVVAGGLNYEAATSHTVVVRATDAGGLSFDKTLTINVQNVNELVWFDVQRGASQRSYIRYVDLFFESGVGLNQLITEGRVRLTRFGTGGANGVNVALGGKLRVVDNRIVADFGANGIGGNRNGPAGNGYYRFALDTDRDGTFEAQRHFYRLLGDTNGDRTVNSLDRNSVNAAVGRHGTNLNPDVNGDGVVNSTDQSIVRKNLGKSVASWLPLDD